MTVTGTAYYPLKKLSYSLYGGHISFTEVANWEPKDAGYAVHVLDTTGEWVACLSLAIYAAQERIKG